MKIKNKPHYFHYITQSSDDIFENIWSGVLRELKNDLSWIDRLEKEDDELYSRDYDHDDFQTYWNWPQNWRDEFENAKTIAHKQRIQLLSDAEKYEFDGQTIWIKGESVYLSTSSYACGDICLMTIDDDSDFDSVVTAAYAYINEWQDWNKKYGLKYEALNILSKAERPFTDSLVGTTQECDGCGSYSLIVEDKNGIVLCKYCAAAK